MQYLNVSDLIIPPDRQRKQITPQHINDLKASIRAKGLLHPVVVRNDGKTLVVGECRSRAIVELWEEGHSFQCNGQDVPPGTLPTLQIGDLTPDLIAGAEYDENIIRFALTWQEQTDARILIHGLQTSLNPSQTLSATAAKVATASGKSQNAETVALHKAFAIKPFLDNPKVRNAKSQSQAYAIVQDLHAARLRSELVSKGLHSSDHQVILGDCREVMKTLLKGSIDLILTDPPYGIGADDMKKSALHTYDDSPEHALDVCKAIIREGFDLLKPRGNLILFCDFEHFKELRDHATAFLFTPWRTPLIWLKSTEGFAPWGITGFSRTYECLLFATKGQKGTKELSSDVKQFKRTGRDERTHAAEKPVALLRHFLSICGDPGDVILDPCCGSGSILPAATAEKMKVIAIERDPDYHVMAQARLLEPPLEPEEGDNAATTSDNHAGLLS